MTMGFVSFAAFAFIAITPTGLVLDSRTATVQALMKSTMPVINIRRQLCFVSCALCEKCAVVHPTGSLHIAHLTFLVTGPQAAVGRAFGQLASCDKHAVELVFVQALSSCADTVLKKLDAMGSAFPTTWLLRDDTQGLVSGKSFHPLVQIQCHSRQDAMVTGSSTKAKLS